MSVECWRIWRILSASGPVQSSSGWASLHNSNTHRRSLTEEKGNNEMNAEILSIELCFLKHTKCRKMEDNDVAPFLFLHWAIYRDMENLKMSRCAYSDWYLLVRIAVHTSHTGNGIVVLYRVTKKLVMLVNKAGDITVIQSSSHNVTATKSKNPVFLSITMAIVYSYNGLVSNTSKSKQSVPVIFCWGSLQV